MELEGWGLKLSQFHGLLVKRFHCAKRNTKGLFSQILLPAFFVCVAMTVALSVPEIGEPSRLWWACPQLPPPWGGQQGRRVLLITLSSLPGDLPPLILSPSQYHNYTQPRGNFIPYTNEHRPRDR